MTCNEMKGYIPYPAGGLCYGDERLRFLVTWSSPYLNTDKGGVEAMGVYGLEGRYEHQHIYGKWTYPP
jgi:hypothetical protein